MDPRAQESLDRSRPLTGCRRTRAAVRRRPGRHAAGAGGLRDVSRRNFLALMFCLMVGTAGLPHLLTRFYTTPSVSQARKSVAWALFFISLLYLSAPALAVLVKFEVMNNLVGSSFDALPPWIAQWARSTSRWSRGRRQRRPHPAVRGEIRLGADIIMLATPEIGGLPYVVSGLVAAGGLAAALSTADGLLLTISNAMVRDILQPRRQAAHERPSSA
jgi:cation/acetate symporter